MEIGIVGAGLAGLATAAVLAADGHSVEVHERAPQPRPLGAGLLLQPPALAFLQRLGLLGALAATGARVTKLDARTRGGRTLIDLDYRDLAPGSHGLGVRRPALWGALLDACAGQGVAIQAGQEIARVFDGGARASIETGSGQRHDYELVIVASGANGVLAAGPGSSKPYRWGCLWTSIALPPGWADDTLAQRCDGARLMAGILPTGDGTAALYWSVRNDRAAAEMGAPASEWRARFAQLWPDAATAIAGLDPAGFVHAVYRNVWADPPFSGRVVAVGDAAHGTSPQLGQGATQGFRDAAALSAALSMAAPIADQLATYWRGRRARTAYYRAASRILTPFFQSDSVMLGMLRDAVAHPVTKFVPGVRRQALLTLAGAKTGYWGNDPVEDVASIAGNGHRERLAEG
jgi:2-polyprenyl-6-methoxyphenol hydroxylase-like FAD-dependent oxidoreductase